MELIDDIQQQHPFRPTDIYSEEEEGAGAKYALGPTPAAWVARARSSRSRRTREATRTPLYAGGRHPSAHGRGSAGFPRCCSSSSARRSLTPALAMRTRTRRARAFCSLGGGENAG